MPGPTTMWTPRFEGTDPVVVSAGAAALCAVLRQHLASAEAEVPSEVLCWAVLPILSTRTVRLNLTNSSTASSISLWIAAAAVAVACCYTAEIGMIYLVVSSFPGGGTNANARPRLISGLVVAGSDSTGPGS